MSSHTGSMPVRVEDNPSLFAREPDGKAYATRKPTANPVSREEAADAAAGAQVSAVGGGPGGGATVESGAGAGAGAGCGTGTS